MGISERGCADVCGRCRCKGKVGNGLGEGPVGMSECARCKENRLEMCGGRTGGHERVDARTCADGVGKGKVGNGWREGPVVCGQCGCNGKVENG